MNNQLPYLKYFFQNLSWFLLILPLSAEKPREDGGEAFHKRITGLDADQNGEVTLAEFSAAPKLQGVEAEKVERLFQHLDKDGDGVIKLSELRFSRESGRGPHGHKRIKEVDANGDGSVSLEEFKASRPPHLKSADETRVEKIFSYMDKNGDGFLNREDGPPPHRERRGGEGKRGSEGREMPVMEKLDLNGDGSLSLEEFRSPREEERMNPERREALFNRLDKNQDGLLSKEEFPARPFLKRKK